MWNGNKDTVAEDVESEHGCDVELSPCGTECGGVVVQEPGQHPEVLVPLLIGECVDPGATPNPKP